MAAPNSPIVTNFY